MQQMKCVLRAKPQGSDEVPVTVMTSTLKKYPKVLLSYTGRKHNLNSSLIGS
jgi:hypothetical protein